MIKKDSGRAVRTVERNDTLDALKGFAILLVMLGHCVVLNQMEEGVIYDTIKAIQMPLFMMVSGYLGQYCHIQNGKELGKKIAKRAVTYLVPFVSWIFVTNVTTFVTTFKSILFQLDRGLWFLVVLFILSAILYIAVYFRDCLGWGAVGFLGVYGVAVILLVLQIQYGITFLSPHLIINYLPFHLLGYLAAQYFQWDIKEDKWKRFRDKMLEKKTLNLFALLSTVLFSYLVLKFDMITASNRIEWLLQMLASLLGSCICIYLLYRIPEGRTKKMLAYIGLYTLEIYVLHFRFATVLGFADEGLNLYSLVGVGAIGGAFCVMSIMTAFFIFTFKRLRITDFLLFGKSIKH